MSRKALVVGGTGPSGVYIVDFLLAAGYEVAVFNSGRHDSGVSFAGPVERLYGDARGIALPVPEWSPRQSESGGYTGKVAEG
ncbi:MAG: hypothetical protein IPN07_14520 [Dehalococcoidia bacterium]|nr:hypothetical protein [Dehalococcoidia bacterium]